MTYIFSLSKEHPDLPRAEVEHVLTAEGIDHTVEDHRDSLLFVDADDLTGLDRLAMTFEVAELLYDCAPDSYQKLATRNPPISTDNRFAVRKQQIDDTAAPAELEQNIGRIIDKESSGHVDLDNPEDVFRVYLYDDTAYTTKIVHDVDRSQYEARQNQYRPFSSPVSMHPRLARALVNLSEVPRDGTVLDPFCGTGGILLEAGLIGCDIIGADIQQEMVNGTRKNLASFDLDAELHQCAFEDIEDSVDIDSVDVIVSDLPYGKASKVEGDPTEQFIEQAPTLADRVVFMTDRDQVKDLEPAYEVFVHRSLSRYIYILD